MQAAGNQQVGALFDCVFVRHPGKLPGTVARYQASQGVHLQSVVPKALEPLARRESISQTKHEISVPAVLLVTKRPVV